MVDDILDDENITNIQAGVGPKDYCKEKESDVVEFGYQKLRAARWSVSDFLFAFIPFSQLLTLKIVRNK